VAHGDGNTRLIDCSFVEGGDMHERTNEVVSIFYQLVTLHIQNGGAIKKESTAS
jgi:hypothetical protein